MALQGIPSSTELNGMTVAKLQEFARGLGLTFLAKTVKADMIKLIEAAASGTVAADVKMPVKPIKQAEPKTAAPKKAEVKAPAAKTAPKKEAAKKETSPKKEGGTKKVTTAKAPVKKATPAKEPAAVEVEVVIEAPTAGVYALAELEKLTVAQLKDIASGELGLTFLAKSTKAKLIEMILGAAANIVVGEAEKVPTGKKAAAATAEKPKEKTPAKGRVEFEDEDFGEDDDDEDEDDWDDVEDDADDDDDDDEEIDDYDDGIDDEILAKGNVPDEVEEDEDDDLDVVDLDVEPDVLDGEVAELEADLEAELAEAVAEAELEDAEEEESDDEDSEPGEGTAAAPDDESFTVSDKDEDDQPAQQVVTAGATADPVKDYLKQIGKVALLNAVEEVELAKRIEAGLYAERTIAVDFPGYDRSTADVDTRKLVRDLQWVANDGRNAKNHLLEANLRLVVSLAKRYTGRGMLFLDLIQEGNLGLIRAVEKFDYTKGYKFSTYATWWIRQAITRAMADQARTIRIPVHMVEVINKLARVQRQMLQDFGREPTPEELAKELDMTPEKVIEVQKYGREPISLHTPLGEDGDSEFGDLIEDSEAVVPADAVSFTLLQDQLHQVLETLSEREAGVVAMRFGLQDGQPKTLDEIGKVYGVTRERIRQIESKTMSKLRHPSRSQVLRDYLD